MAVMRSALALRAEVAAASGDDDAADERAAAAALFSFTIVDAMTNLKFAGQAFGVDVIRNRRAA